MPLHDRSKTLVSILPHVTRLIHVCTHPPAPGPPPRPSEGLETILLRVHLYALAAPGSRMA